MSLLSFPRAFVVTNLAAIFLTIGHPAVAVNNWTNSASGLWRFGTNWSQRRAPDMTTGLTVISNAGTKTVTIDALTDVTNLTLNNMTLLAPDGATNSLRMVDVGTNKPLVLLSSASPLSIARGGAFSITNSSLVITGTAVGLTVWAGSVTLDSGSIIVRDEPTTTIVTVRTRIGRTNEATLNINGGFAQFGSLLLGESPGPQFLRSRGIMPITGGLLNVLSELSLGESAGCTGLVFMTGGQIQIPNQLTNATRIGNFGIGKMSVSNATIFLPNVSVARHDGSSGLLTLGNGSLAVVSDDLSIGRFSGATGAVVVAGGQLIATNQPIWSGREGVGQLTVSDGIVQAISLFVAAIPTNTARGGFTMSGGTVMLSSNLVLGDSAVSTGRVDILTGNLNVTNADGTAAIWLASGPFALNNGIVTTDHLVMTNSGTQFIFSGGTLRTKNTTVDNGLPFVVGDGTNVATLDLLGGTHTFPNGLVISINATLRGCGVVIGSIINHGTIATNCSSSVAPNITQPPASITVTQGADAVFTVSAVGTAPLSYQWRFNGADILGANKTNYTVGNAQLTNAGTYDVVVSDSSGKANSSPATLRVLAPSTVSISQFTPPTNTISFSTVAGLSYTLEYKNTLDETNWTRISPSVSGAGNLMSIPDPQATVPVRFYRLRTD